MTPFKSSEQRGLLSLPNEILLAIISYLLPGGPWRFSVTSRGSILVSYRCYRVDRSRFDSLRSLTQTCRRLHAVTEPVLSKERTLELDMVQNFETTMAKNEKAPTPKKSEDYIDIPRLELGGSTSLP